MQTASTHSDSPGLDVQVLMDAATSSDPGLRMTLALQLAAFLGDVSAPAADRQLVVPVALALLADTDRDVRETLALGLSGHQEIDQDLIFAIVADDDDIALPFLSFSPAVNHWHMLAVLRVGDEARQACVALRPDIAPEAVSYIIDSLPLKIVELLLGNEGALFSEADYLRLFARFGEEKSVTDWLIAQDGLPIDLRLALVRRPAQNLRRWAVGCGFIPANDAVEAVADSEENAVLAILSVASAQQLASGVSALLELEMLTPAIIVRAACAGMMDATAEMLGQLAGVPARRAKALMLGRRSGGFRGLYERAGLPESCFWTVQAACDVAREEREEGYRLTPDDFGRRMIEVLLTHYEALPLKDRPKQLDVVGRFATGSTRTMISRIKAELSRAA